MKTFNFLIIIAVSLMIISCQSTPKTSEYDQMVGRIDTLELFLAQSEEVLLDDRKPREVLDLYKKFVIKYPEDSLCITYYFKMAEVELALGKSFDAISSLDSLMMKFPNADIIPNVLQFKAFIQDDRLHQFDDARATLELLIEKYPDNELVENAKAYILTLGKSPEEVIREMELKNQEAINDAVN
jgi:tetratricopeptide (TPR) repeat protein